jgi:hypothetical protein
MNERIREVWIKAVREDSDPDNWDTQEQFIERFAKLIVRECAQVCNDVDTEYDGEDVLATWCAQAINKHFGIK